jgi:hypothetical protein
VATTADRGVLLLADISGYTDYVVGSPLEYAEDVVSDVTTTVVNRLGAVITVNKLEGDAAFGYALDGELDSTMLLDTIEECYFAFRGRLRGIEHAVSCTCPACTKVADLDLKFVVHHGDFVRRTSPLGEELTGNDGITVHRLLKNGVTPALGLRAYALFTEQCVDALALEPSSLGLRRHVERYEDIGEVAGYVSDLERRWGDAQGQRRVRIEPEEASFSVDVFVPSGREATWELLTSPQKRLLWQVDAIEEADVGGRRTTGASSVCVDGRTRIYEEILDWRPFEYFTERLALSGGVRALLTTSLEPAAGGTQVVTRVQRDAGARIAWLRASRSLRRRLEARYSRLAKLAPVQIPEDRRLPLALG